MAILKGTKKRDIIKGTSATDKISGLAGSDDLYGKGGKDALKGGSGHDKLFGGAGNDTLQGEAGNDRLKGEAGNDLLIGAAGNDLIVGGAGNDTAAFASSWASTAIASVGGALRLTSAADGSDTVSQVEKFKFSNGTFAANLVLNDAPVAVTDNTLSTNEDTQLTLAPADLLSNDADADAPLGDVLTIISVQDAVHGTVALTNGQIVFTPEAGYFGAASFTYTVRDIKGASATGVANIGVQSVNDVPIITSNGGGSSAVLSIAENGTAVTTVAAMDADAGETLTFTISGGADAERFAIDASTGALTFAVAPNYEAPTDANADNVYDVTVAVSDGHGGSDSQALTVTVRNANDAPIAAGEDLTALHLTDLGYSYNAANAHWYRAVQGSQTFAQANATALASGGYLATITNNAENDFVQSLIQTIPLDPSIGDAAANRGAWIGASDAAVEETWIWLAGPEAGQAFWTSGATDIYANWSPGEAGSPSEDYAFIGQNGHWYDFSDTSQVAGAVIETTAGRAGDGSVTTEDQAIVIDAATLLANDTDPDGDTLTISAVTGTSTYGAIVSLVNGVNHDVRYDPRGAASIQGLSAGEHVVDTFTYSVSDGHGGTTNVTATLVVSGAEDVPIITSGGGSDTGSTSMAENLVAVMTVTATDADAGQSLSYAITGGADAVLFQIDASSGALSFLAAPDYEAHGDSNADNIYDVTITVSDGHGGTDAQDLAIEVMNANDSPVAADEDLTSLRLIERGYTYNPQTAHWYRVEPGANTGAYTFAEANALSTSYGGYLATITDSAENGFVHSLVQGLQTDPAISDTAANRGAWIGASDAAAQGTWLWLGGPEAGQAFWTSGFTNIYASWSPGEAGSAGEDYAFMGQSGNWYDFAGGSAVAGYVVENEVGRAGDGAVTSEDAAVTIEVSLLVANDTDQDGDALAVSAVSATSSYGATVSLVGGFVVYDPANAAAIQALAAGEHLVDTFTYTASDGLGGTSVATVTLAVSGLDEII